MQTTTVVGWNMLGATGGFTEEFGPERVRNTPITEAGFTRAAAGAAMVGMRPVVDLMLASFIWTPEETPALRPGRKTVTLSLTADHRAVDGPPAARFLVTLAGYLSKPGALL